MILWKMFLWKNLNKFSKNSIIKDEELVGLNVADVIKLFQERGVKLPEDNGLDKATREFNNWIHPVECTVIRIIITKRNVRIHYHTLLLLNHLYLCNHVSLYLCLYIHLWIQPYLGF